MSLFLLLTLSGLGLAGLYFLVASGLSLVFGLADVLNFAHGLFLSVGAYATWWAAGSLPGPAARGGRSCWPSASGWRPGRPPRPSSSWC
jgi:branched-chain amino acid transport system permease protein